MSAEAESMQREVQRIEWRRAMMQVEGGVEWLLHVSRLYGFRERLIAPDHIGMPTALRQRLDALLAEQEQEQEQGGGDE